MLVVAGPLAAPEIRARRRRRQEHQPALFVGRHRRPDVGMAGDRCRHGPADRSSSADARSAHRRRAPCRAAHRRGDCPHIEEPTTTTPRLTTGAEVIWNSPGHSSVLPVSSLDLAADCRNRRRECRCWRRARSARTSLVPMKIRARQAALSAACVDRPNRRRRGSCSGWPVAGRC